MFKILKEDDPHFLTVWALGFCEGFFASVIVNVFLIRFYCFRMNKWSMMGIGIVFICFNYIYFSFLGKGQKIVASKPKFFRSNRISVTMTIIFFVILISSMFWGVFYTKHLLETICGR